MTEREEQRRRQLLAVPPKYADCKGNIAKTISYYKIKNNGGGAISTGAKSEAIQNGVPIKIVRSK